MQARDYTCRVVEWIDGDTCDVDVLLSFLGTAIALRQRVRVDGINTPETRSSNPVEKANGIASRLRAAVLAPVGSLVTLRSANLKKEREKYGRWLAVITLADGQDFAGVMISEGLATAYHGERRP